ncbi:hypothetical protein [Lignipirellula cremea]|uniref:Uncharacterized protein n=1 Tax=Lignipirellula cremea TaxID=2528010 RepID=A0A518DRM1_9BACT|nr:hypothetical protein [Lignipirellula cremea]QDU94479.1 hypothetical protein Pla8534_22700 [Lignipirellula cremea]
MLKQNRILWRLANAIHERIAPRTTIIAEPELPEATWRQSADLLRRIRLARRHGLTLAARRLTRELRDVVWRLRTEATALASSLEPVAATLKNATVADIFADLLAMREEFGDLAFDRKAHTLSVTTEPLELHDVHLGPFEIRLEWSDLQLRDYRVIAADPHPAASDDGVTHPHVQNEDVCEGEGSQPIRRALEQGRLLDFFLLVAGVLRTYNPSSPYVRLDRWHGVDCSDCGDTVCDDEGGTCGKCDSTLCSECTCHCGGCSCGYCSSCVARCSGCDESCCEACLKDCSRCGDDVCRDCFDEQERCPPCHDEETDNVETSPAVQPAPAAI